MKNKSLIFIAFVLMIMFSYLNSQEVTATVGLALPPYIISENSTGMELEIVEETLDNIGKSLEVKYVPFIRIRKHMEEGKVELAFPTNEASGLKNVYYSDSHITYQNVVVTLKENDFEIKNIDDLKDKSIIAFQDANLYLGEEYKKMAENNPSYKEKAQQNLQISMLFGERVDAIVVDINIFKYFRSINEDVDTSKKVTIHEIFPKTNYKVAFNSEKLRNDFNKSLKEIRKSGKYEKITKKYVN